MKREDAAWCAGILEGEGWFGTFQDGAPRIGLMMTDFDVVRRFAALIRVGNVHPRAARKEGYKPYLTWHASSYEAAQAVTAIVWPWLGVRRRAAATAMLKAAQARTGHNRWVQQCRKGHPFDAENTKWGRYRKRDGSYGRKRDCRICCRESSRTRKAARRALAGTPA